MPMTEQLNAWALNISHDFLEYHDPHYLCIDTVKFPTGVKSTFGIGKNGETNEQEWTQVTEKKKHLHRNQHPTDSKSTKPGGILRNTPPPNQNDHPQKEHQTNRDARQTTTNEDCADMGDSTTQMSELPVTTVTENDDEMEVDEISNATGHKPPATTNTETTDTNEKTITPYPHIPTNDGTHRITVKWTPPSEITEFENDKRRLNEALYTLMTTLFKDADGVFYRWESEDLVETKAASSLTEVTACDFVSPKVTIMASRNVMVFGLRFGFLSGPSKWQQIKETKQLLKDQKLEESISNSKSTSGKVVTAGYILLKAPNTTHKHFYTQYLRSQLPEATPYFDIVRHKKTPMDQNIPHLVVQCGEKHITPLCKSLIVNPHWYWISVVLTTIHFQHNGSRPSQTPFRSSSVMESPVKTNSAVSKNFPPRPTTNRVLRRWQYHQTFDSSHQGTHICVL